MNVSQQLLRTPDLRRSPRNQTGRSLQLKRLRALIISLKLFAALGSPAEKLAIALISDCLHQIWPDIKCAPTKRQSPLCLRRSVRGCGIL